MLVVSVDVKVTLYRVGSQSDVALDVHSHFTYLKIKTDLSKQVVKLINN